jgi:hypothetical protein
VTLNAQATESAAITTVWIPVLELVVQMQDVRLETTELCAVVQVVIGVIHSHNVSLMLSEPRGKLETRTPRLKKKLQQQKTKK